MTLQSTTGPSAACSSKPFPVTPPSPAPPSTKHGRTFGAGRKFSRNPGSKTQITSYPHEPGTSSHAASLENLNASKASTRFTNMCISPKWTGRGLGNRERRLCRNSMARRTRAISTISAVRRIWPSTRRCTISSKHWRIWRIGMSKWARACLSGLHSGMHIVDQKLGYLGRG